MKRSLDVEEPDVAFGGVDWVVEEFAVGGDIDAADLVFTGGAYFVYALCLHVAEIGVEQHN